MTESQSPQILPSVEEERVQAQRRTLRIGAFLGAGLIIAFSGTDLIVVPQDWARLLAARCLAALVLLGLGVAVGRPKTPVLALGALILAAICIPVELAVVESGGPTSPYLLAMLIPLGAVSILIPLRARQAAVLHATVIGIALLPLAGEFRAHPRNLVLAVSYFVTLSFIGLVGARVQESLRQKEHRARLEAARQVGLANLGKLAGALAHELSNPLSVVMVELEMLERENPGSTKLANVSAAALRMRDILGAMRQGARIADGKLRPTDLVAQVELSLSLLGPQLRRVRLEKQLEPVPEVNAQPTLLGQVLSNLLINAGDALKEVAEPRVWVRTRREDGSAVVEVEDNGPGVPEELRARIFEPFFSTKGEQGNGLGLWICGEIARFHGGALTVDSGASGGARFRLSLPLGDSAAGAGAA